ncbi:DEAD/DEAH box helicase [uncultured Cohaesibacter sp.]|uniref:DEAD/DEAH box helicase n=1 Tax=uncultured Cohaesibacter sp. TaxID=1002546 RepID=UPI0029C6CFCE|nr:DEAD/DEAH box helicase [uncultured Cohaesibacter sp.]
MKHFSDLGLAEPILRALEAQGYAEPTPIQSQGIPVALKGKDILGIAQTGTGKTASFVLPILDRLARNDKRPTPKATEALILAPTRELVAQIAENIRAYSKNMRVSVSIVVGGVKPSPQIRKLASGSHIVVATPGRLLDHINNGHLTLSNTNYVVLDEADHMLDLGFIPDIRRIMKQLPKKRQTLLFSATMPNQIKALGQDFQNRPTEIAVATVSKPIERISQSVQLLDQASKRTALTSILSEQDVERAIVFTRTKRGADRVSQHLQKAGLQATAIHGNKSQGQRVRALASFKSGEINIMVATDIAARGIDIDDVSHVINFELPEVPEAYVHRIGRTARAGKKGTAISLCDPSEVKLLREIEKLIGNALPAEKSENYSPLDLEIPDTPPKSRNRRRGAAPSDNPAQANNSARTGQKPKSNGAKKARKARSNQSWSPLEDNQPVGKSANGKKNSRGSTKANGYMSRSRGNGSGKKRSNAEGKSARTRAAAIA